MSDETKLIEYFIERTDARLSSMEKKIDKLMGYKWKVTGIVIGVTSLVTLLLRAAKL